MRRNLDVRRTHIIGAAGELEDEKALPLLYELYKTTNDFNWHLTIGRTIWKINGDNLYPELLRQLKIHPTDVVRQAHFEQVTDLRNIESIEMLFDYLNDQDNLVQRLALSKLNFLETGKFSFELLHDKKYFLDKRTNDEFKERLLKKLEHEY